MAEAVCDLVKELKVDETTEEVGDIGATDDEGAVDSIAQELFGKGKIKDGCEALEKGLIRFNSVTMFELAVERLCHTVRKYYSEFMIYETLHDILELGLKEEKLSELCFKNWIGMCCAIGATGIPGMDDDDDEELEIFLHEERERVLKAGLEMYPDDLFLNEQMVLQQMNTINEQGRRHAPKKRREQNREFERVLGRLRSAIAIASSSSPTKKTDETFDETLFRITLFSSVGKPEMRKMFKNSEMVEHLNTSPSSAADYLEFLYAFDEVETTRDVYSKLRCKDDSLVLLAMARIENRHFNGLNGTEDEKCQRFRDFMERACLLHGKDEIDVWLKYMELEKELGYSSRVSEIYARAMSTVNEELKASLSAKYSEI